MKNIFEICVSEDQLNPRFKLLATEGLYMPAKRIISNITSLMHDQDGNFIQQFQSTGFESRLWEIYLYILLLENNFQHLYDVQRPDFHVRKNEIELFVEASLSSEKTGDPFTAELILESIAEQNLSIQYQLTDYYVMRMGSVLFSKLNKEYWKLGWVKGKPLILAITPAHNLLAQFLPDSKIIEYLYGRGKRFHVKNDGTVEHEDYLVTEHRFNEKVIPSNFFSQPNAENISAVLFTNNSGIDKFNRMGYQHKLYDNNLIIIRTGTKFNPDHHADADEFHYLVSNNIGNENWSESVSLFHNPNALVKLDKSIFKNIRQLWIDEDNEFNGIVPHDFVYHSITTPVIFGQ